MKLSRIFITIILLHLSGAALAQKITLSRKNITLDHLFDEIKKQTGYDFLYNPRVLEKAKPVNVEAVKTPLRTVLDNCFAGQPLTYTIDQRTIIVKEKQFNHVGYSIISGRITDKDKKSVSNASVFLNNATVGSKTDTSGHFRLENVKPGKYDLVVSIVGFETYHKTINAIGDDISLPDIELNTKTIALQEVVIKRHNYKAHAIDLYNFKNQFLGDTYLAHDCEILNPQVLDFDYDDSTHTLRATTDNQLLVIDNKALGYRIRYLLDEFRYDGNSVKYNGSVLFEPMHGSPSQERRWAKKRQEIYATSEMHFMRALLNKRVENEGFRVLAYLPVGDTASHRTVLSRTPMPCTALLHPTDQDDLFAFGTKYKALYVEYNKNQRFHDNDRFLRLTDRTNFEASVVSFTSPYLYFDQNGWVSNPNDVTLLGAWENYRVAGMLPADYEPGSGVAQQASVIVADTTSLGKQLTNLKHASDTMNDKYAAEKMYIQFDKPYYASGDTIWLKAYLLNEPTYGLSARSGLMHVDVANDSNKVIKQYIFPV
ncbi:MAG TPA: carboxypeptidase-like regulatory domain-containing protein, partial [Mucilaginibacter sp.]|nr:carboxypeptidase-like regulatory domain-containing protein [Mucilaginibacter sp.]